LKYFVGECYLEIVFRLCSDTNWAKAGHEVAFGQIQLAKPKPLELPKQIDSPTSPRYTKIFPQVLEISSEEPGTVWQFNIVHGTLSSWKKAGSELIHTPPVLDFYRAITDNDRPSRFGQSWRNSRLHQTQCHTQSVTWSKSKETGNVEVVVVTRVAPPVLEWSVDTTFTYTFTNKQVLLKVAGKPRGEYLPNSFARIGLTLSLNSTETARWFGRGPGEGYWDKKRSQKMGNYTRAIDDLFTDYEFPQETGNRTDVRWVEFNGVDKEKTLKANFGDLEGASFSALHYTTKDLDESQHPYEIYKKKKEETIVRLDWAHHGLGTGSCGPATLPQYELRCQPFEYHVLLE
jgi:beta-galactosidase